ncbi:MAG: DUF4837 family protein [Calditrichaeota bacterium]|nr:DUF4837 family protein [Calditrichota bacterium]
MKNVKCRMQNAECMVRRNFHDFPYSLRAFRSTFFILHSAFSILHFGCSTKPYSSGEPGGLVVVADEFDRPVIRGAVERTFGREIETPQGEPHFRIEWIDAGRIGDRSRSPILLMAATTDGEGPTAEMVRKMLTGSVAEGVAAGDYLVFRREDPWARDQLLLMLVGRSRRELGDRAGAWCDSLYRWAYDFEMRRTTRSLFRRGEQTALAAELERRYGFRLRIQHDYLLAEENDSLQFVRLLRHYPDRWLTVAWGDLDSLTLLTPLFVFDRRRTIGNTFLDPVVQYEERMRADRSRLGNRDAILIRGLWATVDPTGGGPFFSYAIADSSRNRYYIIDGAVFAPGEPKMPFLWQLDAIARTFEPR